MGIGFVGLGIGNWGLCSIPNPQSPIPNPQSPIIIFFNKVHSTIINFLINLELFINFLINNHNKSIIFLFYSW